MSAVLAILVALMALQVWEVRAYQCNYTVAAPESIQDAVDAAGVGEVVCLDDIGGAFAQSVVFSGEDDSFTTLTAAPGAYPLLDGTSQGGTDTGITIDAAAHEVIISALEIVNFGRVGIRIDGYDNKIIEVICNTNGKDGIRIDGNANSLIKVTANTNVQNGIRLVGDDNEIIHSAASGNDDGIESKTGSDRNKISYTTANNNINRGFHLDGAYSQITYVTANGNGPRDHAEGITLHGGGNIVSYSTANGNFSNGINASKGHRNNIHDNTASNNLGNGFYVSSDNNNIYENTASNNLGNGIRVVKDNNNIHGNTANDNGMDGIFLTVGAGRNTLSVNAVSGNTYGIQVAGDNNMVGPGNLANGNDVDGILVAAKGSHNHVYNNTVDGNGASLGNGITVDGDTNTVSGNKISGNTNGIEVTGNNTTITDNSITGNLVNGVVVVAGSGTTINFNVIDGNAALGVSNTSGKEVVDAQCNWWGARDGPGGAFGPGSGEEVSSDVHFSPWVGHIGQYYMGTVSRTLTFTQPGALIPSCALFNLATLLPNL